MLRPVDKPFVVRDRRPGYLRVYNDLYDRFGATLGPYGLAVYMALCRYANQDSECWPSYATIAAGTGMSRRQVIREVTKMETLQIIAVERSNHAANVFILLDTGDTQSPLAGDSQSPPRDSQSPKQDPLKKNTRKRSNKKEDVPKSAGHRPYHPPEYGDVIL